MMLNGVRNGTRFPLKYGLFKKVCNKKMLTADQLQIHLLLHIFIPYRWVCIFIPNRNRTGRVPKIGRFWRFLSIFSIID